MDSEPDQSACAISAISGRFRDPSQEFEYRQASWTQWVRQLRLIAFLGGAFYLAGFAIDSLMLGPSDELWALFGVRAAYAAYLFGLYVVTYITKNPRLLDMLGLGGMMGCAVATSAIIALSPPALLHHGLTALVMVLAIYLFVPSWLIYNLVSALAMSIGFIAVEVSRYAPQPTPLTLVLSYLLFAHLLGFFTVRRMHRLRRLEHVAFRAEKLSNQKLRQEMKERIKAETTARESEERFRRLVELSPDAIVVHRDGIILYANPTAIRLIGAPPDVQVRGHSILNFIHTNSVESTAVRLRNLAEGAEQLTAQEVTIKRVDGSDLPCEVVSGITSYEGKTAFQSILRDISQRKVMEAELRVLADTDSLTGAYNRRRFEELSVSEIQRARRYQHKLSLIMLDIDHFKEVNDHWGHAAGDLVLQRMVTCCRELLRAHDILGRLGGEEFGVILPETDISAAQVAAERLRRKVDDMRVEWEGDKISITVSIGVSELLEEDQNVEDCLRRTDRALYAAKWSGRNLVVVS